MEIIQSPDGGTRLGDWLLGNLSEGGERWNSFTAAVAFAKLSGVRHLVRQLRQFAETGGAIRIVVGVDMTGTGYLALKALVEELEGFDHVQLYAFHNENSRRPTFHPKIYVFESDGDAEVYVGSGNWTRGGLFENYEAGVALRLSAELKDDSKMLSSLGDVMSGWTDPNSPTIISLDRESLGTLRELGYLFEQEFSDGGAPDVPDQEDGADDQEGESPFGTQRVRPAPKADYSPTVPEVALDEAEPAASSYSVFLMTLQQTDVGVGQTTPGTSMRSRKYSYR